MAVKRTGRPVGRPRMVPISPREVEKRKARIEEQEAYLDSVKNGRPLSDGVTGVKEEIDVAALEKQLERDKRALDYLGPHKGTPAERRKAQQEYDEAREYIAKNGLTLAEIGKYPKPDNPEKDADYGRAVEKSMAQEVGNPKFTEMCNQLKRAAAILDPDDPNLRNPNTCRQER